MLPELSTATPMGTLNWPSPEPLTPKLKRNRTWALATPTFIIVANSNDKIMMDHSLLILNAVITPPINTRVSVWLAPIIRELSRFISFTSSAKIILFFTFCSRRYAIDITQLQLVIYLRVDCVNYTITQNRTKVLTFFWFEN